MFDFLINFFTEIISTGGYVGITFLMTLESMIFPVPSEAVMPFAGFLWFLGDMSIGAIVFFSTLGSLIGSLISYGLGFYGGRPLIIKYGHYFLLKEKHLAETEKFFRRFGNKTIFLGRFIPIVRHLISIPAGTGRMNLTSFVAYTVTGAAVWNFFLTYLGYYLGNNWSSIRKYSEVIDIILVVVIVILIFFYGYKIIQRNKKEKKNGATG